jgi:hypothetical protein
MTEKKESSMQLKDALENTFDFQETVESLITSRPDLADPEKLHLFEKVLRRQVAMRSSTRELVQKQAMDAIAAAERERSRKFMSFAITVGGGGAAAILTFIVAPGAPAPVIVAIGLLGLFVTNVGAPRLDRWADRSDEAARAREFQ